MTIEPATCAPPEEHRDKPWHWLRLENYRPEPMLWSMGTRWLSGICSRSPDEMFKDGWRYVAPCELPASEGEG